MKQKIFSLIKKELSAINKGFLLVEVLLATSLFVLFMTAYSGAYLFGQKTTINAGDRISAYLLAESGIEAVRNIRNENFDNLVDGKHGLLFTGGKWTFSGTSDTSGIYTRYTTVASTSKDRVQVTTNVSWADGNGTNTISLSQVYSNWLDLRYWYYPGLISTIGLPNGGDKVQVEGNYAYVTGRTAGTLHVIDVTSSTSPVTVGSITLTGILQNLYVSGNYVYVVSDDNAKELQIVNVTNKASPSLLTSYNAPGNGDAMGVYTVGTTLYMTRQNGAQDEFLILNISNPASPSLLGSLDLGATAFEPIVSGSYAYVASDNNTQELQIINISNPNSPVMAGTLNLSLSEQNRSSAITIKGNMLYLGQGKNLYIIDVSSVSNPIQKSNTSVADYFNDISINLGNKGRYVFVATSDIAKEFKVYDVAMSWAPYVYGTSLDIIGSTPLYGIAYSTSTNTIYVVSHSTTNSFIIISP